jgi:hypothetical protein
VDTPDEIDVDVVTHWGVQLLTRDGEVCVTRWNPSYGSGYGEPYTEAQARFDAARSDPDGWPPSRKRLVTRTETTTVVTTAWEEVQ